MCGKIYSITFNLHTLVHPATRNFIPHPFYSQLSIQHSQPLLGMSGRHMGESRNPNIVPSPIIDSLPAFKSQPGTGLNSQPNNPNLIDANDGRQYNKYRP